MESLELPLQLKPAALESLGLPLQLKPAALESLGLPLQLKPAALESWRLSFHMKFSAFESLALEPVLSLAFELLELSLQVKAGSLNQLLLEKPPCSEVLAPLCLVFGWPASQSLVWDRDLLGRPRFLEAWCGQGSAHFLDDILQSFSKPRCPRPLAPMGWPLLLAALAKEHFQSHEWHGCLLRNALRVSLAGLGHETSQQGLATCATASPAKVSTDLHN